MIKLFTVIGARPQIIKAAALSRAIENFYKNEIEEIIVHTGQHYDQNMSEVFFKELGIPQPNYNLNVGSGLHGIQTAHMIEKIEELLLNEKPNYVVLYGDTNSTLAGAVAASKIHIPVLHIEAGLRSFNRKMPEEVNRIVCDHLSTMLFSPTKTGYQNLIKEGFNAENKALFSADNPGIFHCGDIMYDNSLHFSQIAEEKSVVLAKHHLETNQYILATLHRDHNTDIPENFESIFTSFINISKECKVVLPIHPRTKKILNSSKHKTLLELVNQSSNLIIIPPVSFLDMIKLEKNARLIMTDSGGVQKESYFFNKPCIILRPETEWVEVLETSKAILTGSNYQKIMDAFRVLITEENSNFPPIFGDGNASAFICNKIIENH